jgi:hypothetical protein
MITIQQTVQMPGKEQTNEIEQVSVGRSRGKTVYPTYFSLPPKITCGVRTLIQLLERVVLLFCLHIEVFNQIRYVVIIVFCSTGAGPLLSLLNRLV